MKNKLFLLGAALSCTPLCGQTVVTIHSEDFESGGAGLSPNALMTITPVADPDAAGTQGMVGAGDISLMNATMTGQWAALRTRPDQVIDLPVGVEPGTSTFTVTMMVYVPSNSTFAADDRMGLILRWNNTQSGSFNNYVAWDSFGLDSWQPYTVTGTVPATDGDGIPVTRVYPIISFNDRNDDAVAGVAAYIDDYKIEFSVSADDPNFTQVSELAYGNIDLGGGSITRVIPITNSGTAQTLSVTAANISGTSASQVSLPTGLTFPIDVLPGETYNLEVTLDPGAALGFLSAAIDFTSNDASEAMLTTNISAEVVEPFVGQEFIINGDFETGDLTGWRDDAKLEISTDQARSGTNSASFTLPAANQWNEARFEHSGDIPDSIPITADLYGKEIFYSGWYFRPLTGGPADDDAIRVIFRWNAINGPVNGLVGPVNVGDLPKGVWTRISAAVPISAVDPDGFATEAVTVLWSLQDVNSDAVGGEIIYYDDISIKIDVPLAPADLEITDIQHDATADTVSITYTAIAGTVYAIDRSTGLTDAGQPEGWLELSDSETATGTSETFVDAGAPTGSPKYFYRVRIAN